MNVQAIWTVNLPLKFNIGDSFKRTPLTKFDFYIEDISFELLKNSSQDCIDRVRIKLFSEYDDNYLPSYTHIEYLSEFQNLISYKASKALQSFLDGFSKCTNMQYYNIFDGQDFTTKYNVEVSPNIMSGSGTNDNEIKSIRNFDDGIFEKSLSFACKDKNVLDNAWYLLREAEHYTDLGKYELTILNMSIMIELLVTSTLSRYLEEDGHFIKEHSKKIKERFKNPSFIDKYFRYGIPLITNKFLSEDLLNSIDFIYKVRNKLAHGKQLNDIELLKDYLVEEHNLKKLFYQLNNDVIEIYNYFFVFQIIEK